MIELEKFSVYQFFENGDCECVRHYVPPAEAVQAFKHYTNNVAVKLGLVKRVIIVDSGDCVNMEWIYGKGITFPSPEELANGSTA